MSEETPKKKKSVGFAPLPEEDLKSHHEDLKKKEQEKLKSNPFHKIPPELSYLEKKAPAPKALPSYRPKKAASLSGTSSVADIDIRKLHYFNIKDISVQNKETELNFNYPVIDLPLPANQVLVDIKYASLNSFDLSKINRYLLNLSNTKVGLGYEFAGIITDVGSAIELNGTFARGDAVVGIVDPLDRKGTLSTSLVVNPSRDILVKLGDDALARAMNINIELSFDNSDADTNSFEVDSSSDDSIDDQAAVRAVSSTARATKLVREKKKSPYTIDPEIPTLAKFASFPVLYCRAKQMLAHTKFAHNSGNILINGADTNLGFTFIQLLNSPVYNFNKLNLILIVRDSNYKYMSNFVKQFTIGHYYDETKPKHITILTYDMVNEDLVLPGEKTPINYKKKDYFASEVIEALFKPHTPLVDPPISAENIGQYKLDLLVDLVGSKMYFQDSIRFSKLDKIDLPLREHTNVPLEELFNARVKEPFLVKLLKPKKTGSAFVSGCKFSLSEPTYRIDQAIDYSEASVINPWAAKWSSNLFNNWTNYNYFEELELRIDYHWVEEGLRLLLEDQLKFRIDDFSDWRNDYRGHIKQLRTEDGKVLFKIEDF